MDSTALQVSVAIVLAVNMNNSEYAPGFAMAFLTEGLARRETRPR
jgi:hypothetical protein